MATYTFRATLVSDIGPSNILRTLRNGAVTVKSAADDSVVDTVVTDANGTAVFTTTDVVTVYLVSPSGLTSDHITAGSAIENAAAAGLNNDAGVASFVSDTGSATYGALSSTFGTKAQQDTNTTAIAGKLDAATAATTYGVKDQRDLLLPFYAALGKAKAAAGACDILTITDSIGEGAGVTGTIENRWVSQLRDHLRTRNGITSSGRGYVPCQYALTPPDGQPWALAGGAAVSSNDYYGLGRRVSVLTGSGQTATLTVTGSTSIQLVAVGGTGFGTFSWKVDTGSTTNVNCAGLGYTSPTEFTVDVPLPDQSTHTVTVTWVSGLVWLCGAMLYRLDEVNGLRLWEGGHTGAASSYFTDPSYGWWTSVTRIAPALVIIDLGVNDWSTAPVADTSANLGTIIDNCRAKITNPPSILLIANYARKTIGGEIGTWADRVDAMRSVADDKAVAFLDLNRRMGSAATNTLGMFNADQIHPSNSGSQVIAGAVLDYLENPVP